MNALSINFKYIESIYYTFIDSIDIREYTINKLYRYSRIGDGDYMPRAKFQTLTEQMYYILLCLSSECCGIDIMDKVPAMTDG